MAQFVAFLSVFIGGEALRRAWLDQDFTSRRDQTLIGLVGEHQFLRSLDQYAAMVWSASATLYAVAVLVPSSYGVLGSFSVAAYVASFVGLIAICLVGIRSTDVEFCKPLGTLTFGRFSIELPSNRRLLLYGVPIVLNFAATI